MSGIPSECPQCGKSVGDGLPDSCPHCGASLEVNPDGRTMTLRPESALPAAEETIRPDASHPPQSAQRGEFAGHEILGELGRGGMGLVYLAREPGIGREVALKTMEPGKARDRRSSDTASVFLARFEQEARITGQLQHPGIVPIYRMGQDAEGRHFYTMRPITAGKTLKEILTDAGSGRGAVSKQWTTRRLVEALRSVCLTLAYAHDRGVVHRDLKPSNIVIGDYGEVLVIDWGLAKLCDDVEWRGSARTDSQSRPAAELSGDRLSSVTKPDGELQLTLDGDILGTPAYMSPEQARGELDGISPASDIYSLGAILYEILTLTPPFSGDDIMEVLENAASGNVEDLMERAPERDIPEDLASITGRAMERGPQDRYRTAREMADDLGAWLDGVSRWRIVDRLDLELQGAAQQFTCLGSSGRRFGVEDGVLKMRGGENILLYNRRFSGELRLSCTAWCEGRKTTELSLILCAAEPEKVRTSGADGYCLQFGGKSPRCLNVARHQEDVLQIPALAPEAGRKYSLVAEASGGEVSLKIDDEEVVRWRDPSPLSGGYVGLYGFGRGACFADVVVESLGKPVQVSILETPDAFFDDGMYERALEVYREIAESHPHRAEGLRAEFKAGLCLINMGDFPAARRTFRNMQQQPASLPLGVLGEAQLLELEKDEAAAAEFLLSRARAIEGPSPRWMEVALYAFERARSRVTGTARQERREMVLFDRWFEAALLLASNRGELAARANSRYFRRLLTLWFQQHVALDSGLESVLAAPDLTLDALAELFRGALSIDARMLLSVADEFCRLERWGSARSVFNLVLREFPENREANQTSLRGIGRTWVDTLHFNEGLGVLNEAINSTSARRPRSATLKDCADACRLAGRYDEAFEYYMKIAGRRPWRWATSRGAFLSAGQSLLAKGEFERALEHFRSASERVRHHVSTSAGACRFAGLALHLMGRADEARAHYEHCRTEFKGNEVVCMTYVSEGIVARTIGHVARALECFKAILGARRLADEYAARALTEIGNTYFLMGRYDEAGEILSQCLKQYSPKWEDAPLTKLSHAHVLRMQGCLTEALDKYLALVGGIHPAASHEASLWAGLVGLQQQPDMRPLDSDHLRRVALTPVSVFVHDMTARNWWAIALMGEPASGEPDPRWQEVFDGYGITGWTSTGTGLWLADDGGVPITPAEALRRSDPLVRERFEAMLAFRASFDSPWQPPEVH